MQYWAGHRRSNIESGPWPAQVVLSYQCTRYPLTSIYSTWHDICVMASFDYKHIHLGRCWADWGRVWTRIKMYVCFDTWLRAIFQLAIRSNTQCPVFCRRLTLLAPPVSAGDSLYCTRAVSPGAWCILYLFLKEVVPMSTVFSLSWKYKLFKTPWPIQITGRFEVIGYRPPIGSPISIGDLSLLGMAIDSRFSRVRG